MVRHGGNSAGSYLADHTSPIPSHCASIVVTSTWRVNDDCNVSGGYDADNDAHNDADIDGDNDADNDAHNDADIDGDNDADNDAHNDAHNDADNEHSRNYLNYKDNDNKEEDITKVMITI